MEVEKIFIPVAISKGIKLFTSEDSFLSFFNSPYYAHKNITAIDLYPRYREFGKPALCPVSGKVIETRNIKTPHPSKFEKSGKESLIIIRSDENPKICIKILHLLGSAKKGDHVEIGDEIGNYIRSGFFSYWTDPHIHVEVRPIKDAIRTRGGFEIKPIINLGQADTIEELVNFNEVKGKIIAAKKDYLLIKIDKRLFCKRGFFGLKAMIRNQTGILDCGIPHFGFGGVFLKSTSSLVKGDIVRVWGIPVGRVSHILNHQNYILSTLLP